MTTSATTSFCNGSFLNGSTSATTNLTSGGVSVSSLYNTEYLDSKYDYTDTKDSYEISYTGRDAVIETDISNFTTYIENGQEDKALAAYEELLAEMSSQERYSQLISDDGDDSQLRAIARTLIEETLDEDTTLQEFIEENTADIDDSYIQRTLYIDSRVDSTTQEDLLKEICDLDVNDTITFGTRIKGAILNVVTGFGISEAFDALFGKKEH